MTCYVGALAFIWSRAFRDLYSQGGFGVALLGAAVMGVLGGAAWGLVVGRSRPSPEMSVFGGLMLTGAVFLAIDSPRNSTLVSYGLVWGVGLVGLLWLGHRFQRAWGDRRGAALRT